MDLERSNNQVFTTSFQRYPNFRRSRLLPVELLVEIFLLSLPPLTVGQARQRTTLALVCRLWNDIIEGTPVLWSRISFKDTTSYVMKSLRKSAKSPIDVYGVCSCCERYHLCLHYWCCHYRCLHHSCLHHSYLHNSCGLQLLREVRRHSDRWRRVVLQVVDEEQPAELAPTHSPYLEFLGLFSDDEDEDVDGSAYHTLVTSSRAPCLRELILDHIGFAGWDISFPPTLSSLAIQKSPISPRQILTVLAASPNLTTFRLSGSCVPETNDGALDSTLVELSSLRKLTFNEVESDVIRDVMGRLKFPLDCKVSLKCSLGYDPDPKESFLDPALSQYRETFQRVGEIVRVRISLQFYEINVILQFLRWDITLQLPDPPAVPDILEWFGISTNESAAASHSENYPINPRLSLSNIPISLEVYDYSPLDLWGMNPLLNLGCISRIKVADTTSHEYSKVLSYLEEPLVPPSPATTTTTTSQEPADNSGSAAGMQHVAETWPVPGVCELALQSSEDYVLRAVTKFIKARWPSSGVGLGDDRAASGESPAARLPARLKRVGFGWEDDTPWGSEDHRTLPSDVKAWPSALLDLLEVLDENVRVFWWGKRISKAGIMD